LHFSVSHNLELFENNTKLEGTTMATKTSISLDPQTDGISSVRFSSNGKLLLVTSWDGAATIYPVNTEENKVGRVRHSHAGAVLTGVFDENVTKCYCGGLDTIVRAFQLEMEGSHRILGKHEAAIRCCEWIPFSSSLATGSWDRSLKIWDPRSSTSETASLQLPERVFAMDICENTVLLGLGDGSLHAYDIRSVDVGPFLSRPSTIGHQIRCLRMFEKGAAVLIGSIEGRVSVENLDVNAPVAKRYAFKCHRIEETVYPVNAIAVRPSAGNRSPIFATGGGDGTVVLWDANLRKRVHQFATLNTSCSYLDFTNDGSHLAIASSYCFERGDIPHAADELFIVNMSDVNA
jgi:cell cycle arrest protein BUB3